MNSPDTRLFIFTLPQKVVIDDQQPKLICNIVIMPKFSPLLPLVEGVDHIIRGFAPFATSDIQLTAFLVKGNEQVPRLDDHNEFYAIPANELPRINTDRTDIFTKLGAFFTIDDKYGRDIDIVPIKKYLPSSYTNAFGFAGTRQGAVTDDSYFCALKQGGFKDAPPDPEIDTVNWSQVMAFCLHQPALAKQLGMLYEGVEMNLPSADYFAAGGWVYADFLAQPGIDNSYHNLLPEKLQRYGAWIPAVTETHTLFSPVLFPVEEGGVAATFDDVFDEVLQYSDGFAKIVHASQPVSTDHLAEATNGKAPVTDTGIRLAWDDEQVLEWYNRGFQSLGNIKGAGTADTPLVVSRYRVDVAQVTGGDLAWKSQVSVVADNLRADGIELGNIDTELGVQVSPAKHGDTGNYWLPAYFVNWNGTGLCVRDELAEELNRLREFKEQTIINEGGAADDIAPMMYRQKEADKLDLKYGETYAFRVRLSDISGGGPGVDALSRLRGEHKIAIQSFKRYVAPQAVSVQLADDGMAITIERPRLNYPAILFTGVNTEDAKTELLADRQRLNDLQNQNMEALNRKFVREVSLPDPDVTRVEIVVEVKSLDMDVEDSYHSKTGVSPKDSFVFLYKTYRNFPEYVLDHNSPNDLIDLALSFKNVAVIQFGKADTQLGLGDEIHSEQGPLQLPSARNIRLTIRSFCPEKEGLGDQQYFGSDKSRFSIPSIQAIRHDPVTLEEVVLLAEPADPLLSVFFRPGPIVNRQFMNQQKMQGKPNQTDADLLDKLASITGLVHKSGALIGNDNIRTQFGCSSLIHHTIAPDRSSVTFSGRDDFYHRWINIVQLDLNRDWTWDLLKPNSFKVSRQQRLLGQADFGAEEDLGGIYLANGLNWQAMHEPDRSLTRLVFIDVFDPKPAVGQFPEPVEIRYIITPQFKQVDVDGVQQTLDFDANIVSKILDTVLPITTPPAQVPVIVSTGIALTPDLTDEQLAATGYSETADRNRYLWVEFDRPLADEKDMFFARVLAYAPDPMLAVLEDPIKTAMLVNNGQSFIQPGNPNIEQDIKKYLLTEQPEPPINLPDETVRVVRPLQPFDKSGLDAMQAMTPANKVGDEPVVQFLLPLPPGIYPDSEELFGFFTYEFRVGHADPAKWSTAQGRFGSPLRVTGVQHPAPPMLLNTNRQNDKILLSTRHAQSYFKGKNCTPVVPRTDIYGLLYAQVLQADGKQFRNVLLDTALLLKPVFTSNTDEVNAYDMRKEIRNDPRVPFIPPEAPVLLPGTPPYAVTFWNMKNIRAKLRFLGIDDNAPLSVITIELLPPNNFHDSELRERQDMNTNPPATPQKLELDRVRILRTSRLCKVKDSCAVEG